jgi:uncharacterized protein
MDIHFLWLAVIALVSYATQAMAGFGSTILALSLGVHLYPIDVLLPVLVPLDLIVNLYIVTRHHRHIDNSLLFRKILPAMGFGLVLGIIMFSSHPGRRPQKNIRFAGHPACGEGTVQTPSARDPI